MKLLSKNFFLLFFIALFLSVLQAEADDLPYIYKDKAECTNSGCKNCQEVLTAGYKTIQCVKTPTNTTSSSNTTKQSVVSPTLSVGEASCESGFTMQSGVCIPSNTGLPDKTVQEIAVNLMNWLLGIFAVFGVIAFVISGIQYLVSTGDTKIIETAKRNMVYSGVGIIVGLSGLIIIKAIQAIFSANSGI